MVLVTTISKWYILLNRPTIRVLMFTFTTIAIMFYLITLKFKWEVANLKFENVIRPQL